MAGHSKWKNIAHRKGKQDASRGQLFTKLCRDVFVAARRGGANADSNYHLKMALEKAKAASVPNDTLARTIAKATGTLEGVQYEDMLYEGYGPSGTAILLEISSSNRNRTAAEIRHLFTKYGGSLGETGCVAWMFKRTGQIMIPRVEVALSEDDFTLLALEAGVEDVLVEEDDYMLLTEPEQLTECDQALCAQGIKSSSVDIAYLPTTTVTVSEEDEERVTTLLSLLEEHDDVQSLYTNAEFA